MEKNVVVKTNNFPLDDLTISMREYAIKNNVPIIKDEGLIFINDLLNIKKPKRILEIGSAIGYSAIQFCKRTNAEIYTIERDEKMYNEAIKNIKLANLEDKIHIIFGDALEIKDKLLDLKFDCIFIDAAKAQYMKFFCMYTPLLNDNGLVLCDNMLFHGLVLTDNYDDLSKNLKGLVKKLNAFREFLLIHSEFDTTIYDIGDGISVSVLK